MPLSPEAPAWVAEIALACESTSQGQFILSGNVHDRIPCNGVLMSLAGYLETELLAGFQVVFTFDLGNGLRVTRGANLLEGLGGTRASMRQSASPWRRPVDALWVFLDESGRWLQDQEEIFGGFDELPPDSTGAAQDSSHQLLPRSGCVGELQ